MDPRYERIIHAEAGRTRDKHTGCCRLQYTYM